jgi:UrcA family protein
MGAMTAARAEDGRMTVNLAGLNLDTAAGAQVALSRIRYSAGAFCDAAAGWQGLERDAIVGRCTADMTQKGVDQLHAPIVAALLRGQPVSDRTVALARK